ncbi:MAG: hypothetical protein RLZ42_586, partial [Armatimonadota bacterium]
MMTEPDTTPTSNPMPASPPSDQPQIVSGTVPGASLVALTDEHPGVVRAVPSSGFGLVEEAATTNTPAVTSQDVIVDHTGPELVAPVPPDPASILAAPALGTQIRASVSEPIIALSNVSVQYTNGVKALADIDLMIP